MKLALLGDMHISARNDSLVVMNYQLKFFETVLFPFLKKHKIKTLIQAGDVFDRRKFTNHSVLYEWKKRFFTPLEEMDVQLHITVGNHDCSFANMTTVNSPSLLLNEYDNIIVYSEPTEVDFDGTKILMVPWMCKDNLVSCNEAIMESKAMYCVGHFELSGFEMYKGHEHDGGMDKRLLKKFSNVWSGHYHTRSNDGRVYYLGTPYELTWNDYNDQKGFYSFDTRMMNLEFHKNPHTLFNKLHYDDGIKNSTDYHKTFDLSGLENTYVKIVVVKKNNPYEFDKLLDKLYNSNLADLKIVDDFNDVSADDVDDEDLELEDTMSLTNSYIDNVDIELDKEKLKNWMKQLYVEALNYVEV